MVKEIELFGIHGTGKVALVDDEDYFIINMYKWRTDDEGYVNRKENNQVIMLHRFIMGAADKTYVDHINHNTLDNRKENLRICSNKQNCWNSQKHKMTKSDNKQSKYKGVKWHKAGKKWIAAINKDRIRLQLGVFDDEELAAHNYDYRAIELYGDFAYLNFPDYDYSNFIPHEIPPLTSKYLFVCLNRHNTWRAAVPLNGQQVYLSNYSSEEEAAKHADYAMWHYYKSKERLNFPEIDYDNFQPIKIVDRAKKIIFGKNNDKDV